MITKKTFVCERAALARAGCRKGNSTFYVATEQSDTEKQSQKPRGATTERHSFLQYALLNFREGIERYQVPGTIGGSLRGTFRLLDHLKIKKGRKDKHQTNWTWKELTDMVKYSPFPLVRSLLKLESDQLNRLAVDSFTAIMRYMGDMQLTNQQRKVECVYTILVICHHHKTLRDEVYCQLMKQTTNNKSLNPDSCSLGWRLLAFVTAFFRCSDSLMPYLVKHLETAAKDFRRTEQGTAEVCLNNLVQTVRYGGRRNVPSEDEVESITRGEMNISQAYFLPGGIQQFIPTATSTVVRDVTERICHKLGIHEEPEFSEFSLYCIVEGDHYTMSLEKDEYVLDLVAELMRNGSVFYLIFCRSVWHFPLRLDSELYIEIMHHQVIPDYLEGYLFVSPSTSSTLLQSSIEEIARVAALLHRCTGADTPPIESEVPYLIPKPATNLRQLSEREWTDAVKTHWEDMTALEAMEAKAQCLDILQKWPLFGSCFFGVKMIENGTIKEYILAVNKTGINVLNLESHETLWRFTFTSVFPPQNTQEIEGTTYMDMDFGNDVIRKTVRLQIDHAHEVMRLIKQYQAIQKHECKDNVKDTIGPSIMIKV